MAFVLPTIFRFISHSYINPHRSVEKFKAAGPCDTDEKIQLHTVEKYLFQLLPFQRTFPEFLTVFTKDVRNDL